MLRSVGKWLFAIALVAVALLLALQLWYLMHLIRWRDSDPESTRFMRVQLAELQRQNPRAQLRQQWVPYRQISTQLKRAVIASEDAGFPDHDGVDWSAIERAFERNSRRGRISVGGSTITMQLAKNLFLSSDRSYLRKGQEVAIAFMIEAVMSKRRILEIYLNVAEWGVGVFGAEAAARHHFGVSAAQLSAPQAARLAAMLPRPRYYDRNRDSAHLARRAAVVQRWMPAVDVP
ncbi:MAG: monofunctional biosynthetic peptidoglycan transglycosylase [Lautropia sp.]